MSKKIPVKDAIEFAHSLLLEQEQALNEKTEENKAMLDLINKKVFGLNQWTLDDLRQELIKTHGSGHLGVMTDISLFTSLIEHIDELHKHLKKNT